MYFLDNNPSENRMKFTKLKVACKYCEILFRKKDGFSSWDFVFRIALSGFCAEICIESKWVCRHIKLSYDLEQNATNDETQFDMAVNPL